VKNDKLFELGRELGDLERQKRTIEERIRQIKLEVGLVVKRSKNGAGPTDSDSSDGSPTEGSIAVRILRLLQENPAKRFQGADVAERTGISGPTVRSTLARLFQDEQIDKPERGIYQAKGGT
jgi:DNA-binding transcriptional ArsR family regulator